MNDQKSRALQRLIKEQERILQAIQAETSSRNNTTRVSHNIRPQQQRSKQEKLGPKVRKSVQDDQVRIYERIQRERQQQNQSKNNASPSARHHQHKDLEILDSFVEEQNAIWGQIQKEQENTTAGSPANKRKRGNKRDLLQRRRSSRQRLHALDSFGRTERRQSLERAQIAVELLGSKSSEEQKSRLYEMARSEEHTV